MKSHLRSLRAAEKALQRAAELYAQQGHEDLYRAVSMLLGPARVAIEVVETVIAAGEQHANT